MTIWKLVGLTLGALALAAVLMVRTADTALPTTNTEATPATASATDSLTTDPALAALQGLSFDAFVDASYIALLRRHPQSVTHLGLASALGVRDDTLNDYSDAYLRETQRLEEGVLELLRAYDREALHPEQRLTYDVYAWYLDDLVRGHPYLYYDYFISPYFITSLHYRLEDLMAEVQPVRTVADAEDYVARLWQVGRQFDQITSALRSSAEEGVVLPRPLIDAALPDIDRVAASTATATRYFTALQRKLRDSSIASERAVEFLEAAEAAINEVVRPAYGRLAATLRTLRDIAPEAIGYGQYPGGDAFYANALRHYSQTDLTPDEVHRIGRAEVARITDEIRALAATVGAADGAGLAGIYAAAASRGGTLYGQEILKEYERLIEAAREALAASGILPLPAAPVVVIADPIGGFYRPPAVDGTRPGAFYAAAQGSQSRYRMPSLAYHEAIPGHHLQIAIAGEAAMPLFRTIASFIGYVEGWALYAERLASDLGWYADDPAGDIGRLQYEMLRAVRLVVDTGIHSQGWSLGEAVDYFVDHVGWSRGEAEYQIVRYAVMPGHACGYMLGMLKLLELREDASVRLGDRFDLAGFHEAVLHAGSVPLTVLERIVEEYIEASAG